MTIESAFLGTLGGDAENKISKTGKPYVRMNVRTGEGDAATWISVTSFDPDAIDQARKFVKGSRVYCEGRISIDQWTAQDGTKRVGVSCMAWHTRLAQIGRAKPKRKAESKAGRPLELTSPGAGAGRAFDDSIPFSPEWRP